MRLHSTGFTLLEPLVVMVLIGIILSFAVLSVGGGRDEQAEREAQRLAALIELAREEAVLQAREQGVAFTEHGYRFMRYTDGQWQVLAADEIFRPRTLPEGLELSLHLESLPVSLDLEDEPRQPHLLLHSSGEQTPFELELAALSPPVRYRLSASLFGPITLEGPLESGL